MFRPHSIGRQCLMNLSLFLRCIAVRMHIYFQAVARMSFGIHILLIDMFLLSTLFRLPYSAQHSFLKRNFQFCILMSIGKGCNRLNWM